MSNIQKLFTERIEVFSSVDFSKISIVTGIIKITLKVQTHVTVYSLSYPCIFHVLLLFTDPSSHDLLYCIYIGSLLYVLALSLVSHV